MLMSAFVPLIPGDVLTNDVLRRAARYLHTFLSAAGE